MSVSSQSKAKFPQTRVEDFLNYQYEITGRYALFPVFTLSDYV